MHLNLCNRIKTRRQKWLVTGVAGFIGSHLLEMLLKLEQEVVGLDNFATGKPQNLRAVLEAVSPPQRKSFTFLEGDIRHLRDCERACEGVSYILHQAALGSVPRSIAEPLSAHNSNLTGFVNMLIAAQGQQVRRFVYASSSAIYGDSPELPKSEQQPARPLSPYAVTKLANELYAEVFHRTYGLQTIGLRYFNVFGARQDPNGPYAAVIPRWVSAMIKNEPAVINGDGSTSRDFCYVANAVQANLLAAVTDHSAAPGQCFNVAVNARTTLVDLFELIRGKLLPEYPHLQGYRPTFREFRPGDIRHSQADISKAGKILGYAPTHTLEQGLDEALAWYKHRGE